MASTNERVAIISLDGLSATQFEILQHRMPAMKSLQKHGNLVELDAAPFSDPQPIWAEILTGEPWYRNGCSGYAVPLQSLNELRVFTENDLRIHPNLLPPVEPNQRTVVINIPLLLPKPEERIWIADGSSPSVSVVSPETLLKDQLFKTHRPRPIVSMGAAMADNSAVETYISTEINRLDCALACLQQTNSRLFMYRASIFDQLSHLLGPAFLSETQLQISPRLNEFLSKLDKGMYEILSRVDRCIVLSAFSHKACKETFSLNAFFQNAGFLQRSEVVETKQSRLRREAFAIAANSGDANPLVSPVMQFSTDETICASPTKGTIFFNTKERFIDGAVEQSDFQFQKVRVTNLLNAEIRKLAGGGNIFEPLENGNGLAPQLIINTPHVELVDNMDTIKQNCELPLSVHDSIGFMWSDGVHKSVLKPVDILRAISN